MLDIAPWRLKTQRRLEDRELNQARSKPDTVNKPVRTARIFVHHYNSTQYCNTETVFSIFPFLQTNITSQMWPSGGKGVAILLTVESRDWKKYQKANIASKTRHRGKIVITQYPRQSDSWKQRYKPSWWNLSWYGSTWCFVTSASESILNPEQQPSTSGYVHMTIRYGMVQ